jgi:uncharacterized repeat protein (TIGR03806 family)
MALERPPVEADVKIERVFPELSFDIPVSMVQAPHDPEHWYLVEKAGRITRFSINNPADAAVVLDISDHVLSEPSETGLLGLDFHPLWPEIPEIYVNFTEGTEADFDSQIARFTSLDGISFDPTSEEILLKVAQPYINHNGGHVLFGPDGYLYLGFGDGGSGGDPLKNAQNLETLLGKMLRIDVNNGDPYAIPADNPYADGVDGLPEIYASGLRNPWRYSFDLESGVLYVGDVGQNAWEEVDRVENGGNYGWNGKEGTHCYYESLCYNPEFIDPILDYAHIDNKASIVGGYIYRGSAIPAFSGLYLYADTVLADLYLAVPDAVTGNWTHTTLIDNLGIQPTSFAVDSEGELYLLGYNDGGIWKIVPGDGSGNSDFPTQLSETGCARPSKPGDPVAGMLPYTVNVPLWSDGASKIRYLAIPEGENITVLEDGDFELPVGSVVRKDFLMGSNLIETRLLMHDSQGWAGYSYRWEGSDAVLLNGGATSEEGWMFPSRGECLQCHTEAAGQTLGLEWAQLNRDGQLEDWAEFLSRSVEVEALATLGGEASIESQARSYLHANCSYCHRPEGVAGLTIDLRVTTDLTEMGICGVAPDKGDLGLSAPLLLEPGNPGNSVLLLRMQDTGLDRMPPLGTEKVDEEAAAVVESWISGLTGCE